MTKQTDNRQEGRALVIPYDYGDYPGEPCGVVYAYANMPPRLVVRIGPAEYDIYAMPYLQMKDVLKAEGTTLQEVIAKYQEANNERTTDN